MSHACLSVNKCVHIYMKIFSVMINLGVILYLHTMWSSSYIDTVSSIYNMLSSLQNQELLFAGDGAVSPLWKGQRRNTEVLFKGLKRQGNPSKSITLGGLGMNLEGEFCHESDCGYTIESLSQRPRAS